MRNQQRGKGLPNLPLRTIWMLSFGFVLFVCFVCSRGCMSDEGMLWDDMYRFVCLG